MVPLNVGPSERQLGGENRCRAHVVTTSRYRSVFRFRGIPNNLHVPVSFGSCGPWRAGASFSGRDAHRVPSRYVSARTSGAPEGRTLRSTCVHRAPRAPKGRRGLRADHAIMVIVPARPGPPEATPSTCCGRPTTRGREAPYATRVRGASKPVKGAGQRRLRVRRRPAGARTAQTGARGRQPGATPGLWDGWGVVWTGGHSATNRGRKTIFLKLGLSADRGAFHDTHARTARPPAFRPFRSPCTGRLRFGGARSRLGRNPGTDAGAAV